MRLLLLVFGCLLMFGCAAVEQPPGDVPPPDITMTCEEYCPTLPHIECVGEWNISGAYPDCVCSWECEVEEIEEPAEEQPPNETIEPEPPPEPTIPITNKSIDEMLDDGIQKLRMDFYARTSNGTFQERRYKWKRITDVTPGEIVFDSPSYVRFEGLVIQSLYASGVVIFENIETVSEEGCGLAIFKDTATPLDDYDFFKVDYPSPVINKELRDCWVYEKEHQQNPQGEDLLTYYFKCLEVRES